MKISIHVTSGVHVSEKAQKILNQLETAIYKEAGALNAAFAAEKIELKYMPHRDFGAYPQGAMPPAPNYKKHTMWVNGDFHIGHIEVDLNLEADDE